MVLVKYSIATLAAASLAVASTSCSKSATISSPEDASSLASDCKHFKSDITIKDSAAGAINFDGLETVDGGITAEGASNITDLGSTTLKTVGGDLKLSGLVGMTNLAFPNLEEVDSLTFEALPKLQHLSFDKGISKATNVRISNTGLSSLDGIQLEDVTDFDINSNPALTDINVSEIGKVRGLAQFSANAIALKIKFPNLTSAKRMTFRNVSDVELPSLQTTDELLGFYSNFFQSFSAPNLTEAGSLVFDANSKLTEFSLPKLTKVKDAFQIANNTELLSLEGFPKLSKAGNVDFYGSFEDASVSSFKSVSGAFNIITSSKEFECDGIKDQLEDKVGHFTCKSDTKPPKNVDEEPSDDYDSAASPVGLSSAPVIALAMAAYFL